MKPRNAYHNAVPALLFLLGLITFVRAGFYLFFPDSNFDSDQAIFGIMAIDMMEGRSFPLTFYGQKYLMALHTWLALPFFELLGPSIVSLKLPVLFLNIAVTWLLFFLVRRDTKLPASGAALIALMFALCPVVLGARMMAAEGASVGVLLHILIIWVLGRPILDLDFDQGRSAKVGVGSAMALGTYTGMFYFHREFIIYGTIALYAMRFWGASFAARKIQSYWRLGKNLAISLICGLISYNLIVGIGYQFELFWGPGRPRMPLQTLAAIFEHARWSLSHNVIDVMGLSSAPIKDFGVHASGMSGPGWMAQVSLVLFVVAMLQFAFLGTKEAKQSPHQVSTSLWIYFALVGTGSILAYLLFVFEESPSIARYGILNIFLLMGVVGFLFERWRRVQVRVQKSYLGMLVIVPLYVCWMSGNIVGTLDLYREYVTNPPISAHRAMLNQFAAQHIKAGRAGYWDAYALSFMSAESIIFASTDHVRVQRYQTFVEAHSGEPLGYVGRELCLNQPAAIWTAPDASYCIVRSSQDPDATL